MRLTRKSSALNAAVVLLASLAVRTTGANAAAPWQDHGPLRVAASGRYLEHRDSTPFLWIADTGWALFYKLPREEVVEYLDQRSRQGFNVIQAVAYWYPHGEDGPGPTNAANAYGHSPFEGDLDNPRTARAKTLPGGSPDQPNDYWDHADFIVREIKKRGMYLAMLPCWGRAYINPQMPGSARVVFQPDQARAYGHFLGQRYGDQPHIVWVMGGDANATAGVNTDQFLVYRAMAEGIAQGATGQSLRWDQPDPAWDRVLMTYHPDGAPAFNSSDWFHSDRWLDFNGIETWKSIDQVYETVSRDFARRDPIKPTMLLEGAYEQGKYPDPGNRITALKTRIQAYHTFFAGGAGHTYGAFAVWDFTRDPANDAYANTWRDAVQFPGAAQVATVLRKLLSENKWWTWEPDPALVEGDAGSDHRRVVAVRSSARDRMLVYFPEVRRARIKIDLDSQSDAGCQWLDPRNGRSIDAGRYRCGQVARLQPPKDWEDALLVVTLMP